ncbi:hypothetical protein HN51_059401 [Arachis hypogaea]|uniref:Uncharacterized protein n=1 Tax=Arachis hypogaea TaxID=3818 RepID=A0A444X5C6_ARAHY|nr:vegetative incompatibility protein HET-E-1 isoform X2 [Arachis ipaensis]XP_025684235.1 vegetative incompatibility protein HET-E-1 [Arachis hypogaea]QHN82799.1 putative WD repeat-containing protein.08c [Arachis hypogaea]QHN82800.1 putative WD repeat-containing protein.08c [Arachis hypogaea]RYQ84890.1 hypothetical protein Ahy_B10g104395 [Arachis hypogaea]
MYVSHWYLRGFEYKEDMLLSDDGGEDEVFFDSLDCLSPPHDDDDDEFGYEVWMNEPLCVEERRERFLQRMGMVSVSVSSSHNMNDFDDVSSSNASISCAPTSEDVALFDEIKKRPENSPVTLAKQELGEFGTCTSKKKKNWWNRIAYGMKIGSRLDKGSTKITRRINVNQNKKRWMELSALFTGQNIRAHDGLIWTMKFSPSGRYLASGGQDGVVRIWRVVSTDASSLCFNGVKSADSKVKPHNSAPKTQSFVVFPNRIFQIEESPMQEFCGHSSDVLDLAWSSSDILLSSSMDRTVRMWQIGCNQCLNVFHHTDYVTCIQFNPVDENYFISGSIDGKVRIWGMREERVVDWADIRDVITAISYQPNGKGFVVGSLTGICRFYVASGKHFHLEAQINVSGKKRTSTSRNKITGIQFSKKNHQRVMITSEDSKVRILEGMELVQIFKGRRKSGSQTSGAFMSSEKHIISVGDDSRVYIWNYKDFGNASSKHAKSNNSCEYFCSKGVTVAIPWSGMSTESSNSYNNFAHCFPETQHQLEAAPMVVGSSERFSLGSWFSIDGTCRGSMTWPEEKLPSWDLPLAEHDEFHHSRPQLRPKEPCNDGCVSETWGLSIVAAGCDGTIKTFHNFGLPVRL